MSPVHTFVLIAALSAILTGDPGNAMAQSSHNNKTPVLVELFTSEGCSSCPPADALLAKLDREQPVDGAEIIVLGEHVDYWDNLGWHDRFSSHQYTDRQSQYSSRLRVDGVYTPQMIVNGTDQFVGNDSSRAYRAIQQAAQAFRVHLELSRPVVDGRRISASISAPQSSSQASNPFQGDLYAALVDPVDVTDVRNGENGGRRLQHAGVVRNLQRVGSLKDLASAKQISFSLDAPGDAKPATMRVVVFAQQNAQGAVLGAASTPVRP
jgi:hypothetical protein